jgi:S-DNA-T family DNA segregation ATPase FtsK/SpoIIIE
VLIAASSLTFVLTSGMSGGRLALVVAMPLLLALAGGVRVHRGAEPPAPVADPASVLLAAAAGGAGAATAVARRPPSAEGEPCSATVAGTRLDVVAEGPVALVGDPAVTEAAARWVVCQLAVAHVPAGLGMVLPTRGRQWSWAGALPHASPPSGPRPERSLTVHPGPAFSPAKPGAAGGPDAGQAHLVLVRSLHEVPSWCRRVVEVAADSDGHLVSVEWAAGVASELARSAADRRALPTQVPLAGTVPDPLRAWPEHDGRLAAAFTVDARGAVDVDLALDGPHALVAGTTGSGKSELLLCWVLALACRYPPSALTVVAVDYKGGATFGTIAGLPHVAGVLTDLDGPGTARALAALHVELERRERILASVGARDLDDYRRRMGSLPVDGATAAGVAAMARLLVVVDEFRVLADRHPDLMSSLARVAAQGRSLGIHLILATQRPAGALSSDLRANLGVAICLRVLSPADSLDVLDTTEAAHLPPVPGRALLAGVDRTGAGRSRAVVPVQSAWCDGDDVAPALVARIAAAAARLGEPAARPLWAPPLPSRAVAAPALEGHAGAAPGPLRTLLADRHGARELGEWSWEPAASPLLVVGGPGTGRTTALHRVAGTALDRGWTVHLALGDPVLIERSPELLDHPALGTVADAADPRRLARLLDLLREVPGPAILCVDDVDVVLAACDRMGGAGAPDRWAGLLREARARSLGVAVSGPLAVLGARWAEAIRHRVVLGPLDGGQAALAGVPRLLALDRAPAGRGVLLGDGRPAAVQVLLPSRPRVRRPGAPPVHPRLRPIPPLPSPEGVRSMRREGAAAPHAVDVATLPLGLGGDDGECVRIDLRAGARLVVAGPPESGRTNAVRWIATLLEDGGVQVARQPGRAGEVDRPGRTARGAAGGEAIALVIDDADLLAADDAEEVCRRWRDAPGAVVVSIRSDRLVTGYGGLLALLREARHVLVLAPLHGGCAHLAPAEVLPHADPALPRHPGRGVLVGPRRSVPVQLPALPIGTPRGERGSSVAGGTPSSRRDPR